MICFLEKRLFFMKVVIKLFNDLNIIQNDTKNFKR